MKRSRRGLVDRRTATNTQGLHTVTDRDLAAFASHELRGPLNTLQAFLLIMLKEQPGPLNEVQRDFLGSMLSISRRLHRLAEDIQVVLAKGEDLTVDIRDIDASEVAEECVREIAPVASEYDVSVEMLLSNDGNWRVLGDGDRLSQILVNLLENAVRNSIDGSTVSLHVRGSASRVFLVVENTPKYHPDDDEFASWFMPYVRGTGASVQAPKGSGLGLSVVTHLVSALNGKIVKRYRDGTISIGVLLPRTEPSKVPTRDVTPQSK
jgi:two-component system, OmpR family, phosphate regulon sensor histidine kinase PhoR